MYFQRYIRLRDDRNIRLVLMQTMLKVSQFGHYPEGIGQKNPEAPRVRAKRCCICVEREHGDLWSVLWVKNPWIYLDHFREKSSLRSFSVHFSYARPSDLGSSHAEICLPVTKRVMHLDFCPANSPSVLDNLSYASKAFPHDVQSFIAAYTCITL